MFFFLEVSNCFFSSEITTMATKVQLNVSLVGFTIGAPGTMNREGSMTAGEFQRVMAKKLKEPTVFLFVTNGSEGFVPTPDQTLADLNMLHGKPDLNGVQTLSLSISKKVYMG